MPLPLMWGRVSEGVPASPQIYLFIVNAMVNVFSLHGHRSKVVLMEQ